MDLTFLINVYCWFEEKGVLPLCIIVTLFIVHFLKSNLAIYSGQHKTLYIIITNAVISIIGCLAYILFRQIFTVGFFLWSCFATICLSCGLVDMFDSAIKWVQDKFFKTS
jgi:hypothetical protein